LTCSGIVYPPGYDRPVAMYHRVCGSTCRRMGGNDGHRREPNTRKFLINLL
jgi:hypothetical protein